MKDKDQQLLEEAYNEVIAKMMAGANNPGWTPERAFTSGVAFEPKGKSPKKKETVSKKKAATLKKEEPEDEEEFDVEGDPVGNYQSIAAPPPEEDPVKSMMYVSEADLEKIYGVNPQMWESLFTNAEEAIEQEDKGIVFRYIAPRLREKIQKDVQSLLK